MKGGVCGGRRGVWWKGRCPTEGAWCVTEEAGPGTEEAGFEGRGGVCGGMGGVWWEGRGPTVGEEYVAEGAWCVAKEAGPERRGGALWMGRGVVEDGQERAGSDGRGGVRWKGRGPAAGVGGVFPWPPLLGIFERCPCSPVWYVAGPSRAGVA